MRPWSHGPPLAPFALARKPMLDPTVVLKSLFSLSPDMLNKSERSRVQCAAVQVPVTGSTRRRKRAPGACPWRRAPAIDLQRANGGNGFLKRHCSVDNTPFHKCTHAWIRRVVHLLQDRFQQLDAMHALLRQIVSDPVCGGGGGGGCVVPVQSDKRTR